MRHCSHLILEVTFAALITDGAVQWVIDLQEQDAQRHAKTQSYDLLNGQFSRMYDSDKLASSSAPCNSLTSEVAATHQQEFHHAFPGLLH